MATNKLGLKGLKRVKLNLIELYLKERADIMLKRDILYPSGSFGYARLNLRVNILGFYISILESF